MKRNRLIIVFAILCIVCNLYACSSEPTTQEECIQKYTNGVKNDNAAKTIEQACREIFDTNHIDDEYNDCLLREMPRAETDKDVNIILRLCLMKKFAK